MDSEYHQTKLCDITCSLVNYLLIKPQSNKRPIGKVNFKYSNVHNIHCIPQCPKMSLYPYYLLCPPCPQYPLIEGKRRKWKEIFCLVKLNNQI